jgi:hypothetical protein
MLASVSFVLNQFAVMAAQSPSEDGRKRPDVRGHPRLSFRGKDVDARDKPAHDMLRVSPT